MRLDCGACLGTASYAMDSSAYECCLPRGLAGHAALRWLGRYVTEGKTVSLLKAQLALSALAELRAGEREQAAKLLSELTR
jgi:hypothetical protein